MMCHANIPPVLAIASGEASLEEIEKLTGLFLSGILVLLVLFLHQLVLNVLFYLAVSKQGNQEY